MSDLTEELKNEIKALYDCSLKKPHNVAKEYPTLYIRARKVFGSWKKALEACGIDYEKARNHKKWSRAKVVEEINRLYLSDDNLRLKDLRRKGMVCLISAAIYHFGSWRRAVESCGICYSFGKGKKMTKNDQIIPYAKNKIDNKSRPL